MSFELAAIIVIAALAVILGLTCYHLLGRLDMLERSVQGGLQPPSTRLSREQFEQRFRVAHARSKIGSQVGTGILIVVGPEHHDRTDLARTLANLSRQDLVTVKQVADLDATELGVTTTPYLFIVDETMVRNAQPIATGADVVAALKRFA